jgi:hypothetical protein
MHAAGDLVALSSHDCASIALPHASTHAGVIAVPGIWRAPVHSAAKLETQALELPAYSIWRSIVSHWASSLQIDWA